MQSLRESQVVQLFARVHRERWLLGEAIVNRFVRWVVALGLVVTLSGCWWEQPLYSAGGTSYNPYETSITSSTVGQLSLVWHAGFAGEGSPMARRGDRVLASFGNAMHGFDTETGAEVWQVAGAGGFPQVRDGVFYTPNFPDPRGCGGGASLQAWDVETGARVPTRDIHAWDGACDGPNFIVGLGSRYGLLSGWRYIDPQLHTVYTLRVYDFQTGTSTLVPSTSRASTFDSGPLDEAGQRYYVTGPGSSPSVERITAYSLTGQELWAHDESFSEFLFHSVVDAGRLYVGNRYIFSDDGFDVLDTATGNQLWHGNVTGEMVQPAVRNGVLYTATSMTPGPLLAFQDCGSADCDPIWSGTTDGRVGDVIAAGDVVYATVRDATDHWSVQAFPADGCGAATCSPLTTIAVDANFPKVIVSAGRLFVESSTGIDSYGLPT
jgi:outer membrane protein assembly factor BamB